MTDVLFPIYFMDYFNNSFLCSGMKFVTISICNIAEI